MAMTYQGFSSKVDNPLIKMFDRFYQTKFFCNSRPLQLNEFGRIVSALEQAVLEHKSLKKALMDIDLSLMKMPTLFYSEDYFISRRNLFNANEDQIDQWHKEYNQFLVTHRPTKNIANQERFDMIKNAHLNVESIKTRVPSFLQF